MSKILRVNMTDLTARYQDVPVKYKLMGARWLTSSMVSDEVEPTCHPLGPTNKLVFAPGIVTGTAAPTSARISVGSKSPLTGTIKESNAGTKFSPMLAKLGIKAVVVEGQPKEGMWYLLEVTKDGARLLPATDLAGKGAYATTNALIKRYGKVGVCCIGLAGEMKMAMAGVCFNDLSDRASRYSGRGGLGAVMGTKGLKAMVVDNKDGPGVSIANQELFGQGCKKLTEALQTHAITKPKGALNTYGTAVLINILNEAGGLPTRNFASGTFEGAPKIAGEAIFEGNKQRLGKELYNHACSPGCIIQCSNTWHNPDGSEQVSCQEYESVWAFGANCGIDDLDVTAELIRISNDLGVDTIESGGTIAVAMEGGLAKFGDGQKAIELMQEIGKGTPLGRILGQGAAFTGRALGLVRVPGVKGQNMPAYSPRAVKGIGVTYMTSTQGADHTIGYTIAPEILSVGGKADPLSPEGKAELSRNFQIATAFLDSTGYCVFIAFAILDIPKGFEGMVQSCAAVLGTNWTADDVTRIGKEILRKERAFNEAAGFTRADDRPPEFMRYEALPPHNKLWDIPNKALDSVWDF
ncbi:MAG: aldehyde ferredoxin oxidoreductase [Deltaproteobacteria bacterium]|nr:MAG: aldehyde ferredoxin oxidoreductase [Deltaproteobacteria bacterium]